MSFSFILKIQFFDIFFQPPTNKIKILKNPWFAQFYRAHHHFVIISYKVQTHDYLFIFIYTHLVGHCTLEARIDWILKMGSIVLVPPIVVVTALLSLLLFSLSLSSVLVSGGVPTTLEGPFKPVTVPLDQSFRGNAVDLPDTDPLVQRTVEGFQPEQISISLSASYDSVWISWITGTYQPLPSSLLSNNITLKWSYIIFLFFFGFISSREVIITYWHSCWHYYGMKTKWLCFFSNAINVGFSSTEWKNWIDPVLLLQEAHSLSSCW